MKGKKLKTDVKITYKKNGNIKRLSSPYDSDSIVNNPIFSTAQQNHNTLNNIFKGFGDAFNLNFQQ